MRTIIIMWIVTLASCLAPQPECGIIESGERFVLIESTWADAECVQSTADSVVVAPRDVMGARVNGACFWRWDESDHSYRVHAGLTDVARDPYTTIAQHTAPACNRAGIYDGAVLPHY